MSSREELTAATADLKNKLKEKYEGQSQFEWEKESGVPPLSVSLRSIRVLKGHNNKVYCIDWCKETGKLVSASQDCTIFLWNPEKGTKFFAQMLESQWVMTCGYSDSGKLISSGGLDNKCTVYNVENAKIGTTASCVELKGHLGFISSNQFVSDKQIITASGDSSAILWDISTQKYVTKYKDMHDGSIENVALDASKSLLVTCGIDNTAKLWDVKSGECIRSFEHHSRDVNDAAFFGAKRGSNGGDGSGAAYFVTASDDGTCILYDTRSSNPLYTYNMPGQTSLTSCDLSLSGRLLFTGSHTSNIFAIDTLKPDSFVETVAHQSGVNVTCVTTSPDGYCVGSSGWGDLVQLWGSK